MSLIEDEMFLYDFLNNFNNDFFIENEDLDIQTKLDKHLEKIKKAKEILSEKIKRTPKESSEYLRKQLELLNSRENKLTRHNENLKSEQVRNLLHDILSSHNNSNEEYNPENESHQKLIKSYHKQNMEKVRNSKTDSILKSVFNEENNVSEMVHHINNSGSQELETDKLKTRLLLSANKDEEKEKNNIIRVAMQNLRLQKQKSKENAEANKLRIHKMLKIK